MFNVTIFSSLEDCINSTSSCNSLGSCTRSFYNPAIYRCSCYIRFNPNTNCERPFSDVWNGSDVALNVLRILWYLILLAFALHDVLREVIYDSSFKWKKRHVLVGSLVLLYLCQIIMGCVWIAENYAGSLRQRLPLIRVYYVFLSANEALNLVFLAALILLWIDIVTKVQQLSNSVTTTFIHSRNIIIVLMILTTLFNITCAILRVQRSLFNILSLCSSVFFSFILSTWTLVFVIKLRILFTGKHVQQGPSYTQRMQKNTLTGLSCAFIILCMIPVVTMVATDYLYHAWLYYGLVFAFTFIQASAHSFALAVGQKNAYQLRTTISGFYEHFSSGTQSTKSASTL